MKILKLLLISLSLAIPSILFAIGGNDPISGIDIIAKLDPSSQPIANFSLSEKDIKQYNELKGGHHNFLSKAILKGLVKVNEKHKLSIKWDEIIHKGVDQKYCTPERCNAKTRVIIELRIPKDLRESGIKFTISSKKVK